MDMERSIASSQQTDEALCEALKRHPILKARVMNLLALVDSAGVERADDAERRAIQELRGMGQEVLKDWAENQARRTASESTTATVVKDGEKSSVAQHLRCNRSRKAMLPG